MLCKESFNRLHGAGCLTMQLDVVYILLHKLANSSQILSEWRKKEKEGFLTLKTAV